jgi:hypothetical protein
MSPSIRRDRIPRELIAAKINIRQKNLAKSPEHVNGFTRAW